MNFYAKYKGIGFDLKHFLILTKENPYKFFNYCEIAITENGLIFLACPSHSEIEKYLKKKGFSNICLVWYNILEYETFTPIQNQILETLEHKKLIHKEIIEKYRNLQNEHI